MKYEPNQIITCNEYVYDSIDFIFESNYLSDMCLIINFLPKFYYFFFTAKCFLKVL